MIAADRGAGIRLDWLLRLRWGTVLAQTATVLAARVLLGPDLPLARLLTFVGILAVSNACLAVLAPRPLAPRTLCGAALGLDILLLTGLLHATGGPYNPFGVLYLVYITVAAVVMRARWTWSLALLSSCGYAFLFTSHIPFEHLDHGGPEMRLHLQGMWLARHERLAAVTTLAAGAAHELGTPLATIAVVARELERSIRAGSATDQERPKMRRSSAPSSTAAGLS